MVVGDARSICRAASTPFRMGIPVSTTATSGCSAIDLVDRIAAVRRLADHVEVVLALEQRAHTLADELMVVGK